MRAVRLGTALVIVVWIATSKVWSPQYALWAFAAGALAAAPGWLFAVHAVLAPLDYHVAFETRASRGLIHYFDAVYTAEEVLRFAGYLLLAAWIARQLWRSARGIPASDRIPSPWKGEGRERAGCTGAAPLPASRGEGDGIPLHPAPGRREP
jgi:hypothetical protein